MAEVTEKRAAIAEIIRKLTEEQRVDGVVSWPKISFLPSESDLLRGSQLGEQWEEGDSKAELKSTRAKMIVDVVPIETRSKPFVVPPGVITSDGSYNTREATTRSALGPSLAGFTSPVPHQSDEPIRAEAVAISEKQTVMKIDCHTASGSETKQESEDYWPFKPTPAGIKLRQKLKEEEERKEKLKEEEKERKRKRTKGQNRALAAFMKTTDAKNQTKEWGERSMWSK